MSRKIRVGSRESVLAVNQAKIVMDAIKKDNPHIETELVTISTRGDRILDKPLDKIGGKGLFIKELEQALLDGLIDIAVHSYKDMPYDMPDGLPIVALSKRESPFDVLVLPMGAGADGLDFTKPIGTSSVRRRIQIKQLYKSVKTAPIRGNVITRIRKLDLGEYSALILAEAGLNRLGLRERISRVFCAEEMIPSGSQGIIAVQGIRGGDYSYLSGFNNKESEIVSSAERQYLRTLNGGCSSPVAVYAAVHKNEIKLTGMYVDEMERTEKGSIAGDIKDAALLGEKLALMLKGRLDNK